jgi:aminopeptidase N
VPVQGLALSANRFVVAEKTFGNTKAATYFFPDSAHLAKQYLDAIMQHILLYEPLFGPYPFDKFAVVENFFPTGYGFPSLTLLGSGVIRLPFIIHTSLRHEIAHCWWGNAVYVDYAQGNWSEGLTTYVADYLSREMQSRKAARVYRLQLLRNYATLVRQQEDFPLSRFHSRYAPSTRTVGYEKGAMVFHMIRRLVGEEGFWGALRDLHRNKRFQSASWTDFQKAFEHRSNPCFNGSLINGSCERGPSSWPSKV